MLADNIKKFRKSNNMSQDDLAEKLDVTRQSISLWETGQSQPTIENVIALANIFGVSTDELLRDAVITRETAAAKEEAAEIISSESSDKRNEASGKKKSPVIICAIAAVLLAVLLIIHPWSNEKGAEIQTADTEGTVQTEVSEADAGLADETGPDTGKTVGESADGSSQAAGQTDVGSSELEEVSSEEKSNSQSGQTNEAKAETPSASGQKASAPVQQVPVTDLFNYCKNFAIQIGELNGDYCFYQQPSALYGGYDNEYFSMSYWGDRDMVEFCLHCPLDDTFSINFYLRMRGGYNGKYEYLTSKYYRTDGSSIRSAEGYIDPAVFSEKYPLNCDSYYGSTDGQNEFMEESRVGMCDLIKCLKQFVVVENMGCSFSDFDFVNF